MYFTKYLLLSILSLCFIQCSLKGKPYPLGFSISETKIVMDIPPKDKDFAFIIPGDVRTYIYSNERDYYEDYQRSYFAITQKKGGWDCLRHYEILANGCIPYFIDLERCPENTLYFLPKKLILEAMNLPGVSCGHIDHAVFDKDRYYEILRELLDCTRTYLTTRRMARYLLDTVGYSGNGTILFLSGSTYPDYIVASTLIGLRQVLAPSEVIDVPKVDYIYASYPHDVNALYGKGFTYTKIIDDIPVDRNDIEERIKKNEFEFIIYPHIHRGCPLHDLVKACYSPEKIIYIDGEEGEYNCPFAHLPNFFLREYDAYKGAER